MELAVLLPFIAFLAVIAADWARIYHMTITANACARNAALYASDAVYASNSGYEKLFDAAQAEAPTQPLTSVTSTPTTDAEGNAAVVVTVTITFNTVTNFPGVPSTNTVTRSCQMRVAPLVTN